MNLEFTKTAEKDLKKLPLMTQKQIVKKLTFFMSQDNPLHFAVALNNFTKGGDYRFRIGNYRVVFDVIKNTIFVLHIEHRKDIYR